MRDMRSPVYHVFSCDNDPDAQQWIRNFAKPLMLVSDAHDMKDSVVRDIISDSDVLKASATSAVCGWVCHTVPGPEHSASLMCAILCMCVSGLHESSVFSLYRL